MLNEQHVMKDDIVYHLQLSPPTFRLVLGHLNKVVFRVPQFCKILNRAAMETTIESFQLWKTFYRYNLCSNRSLTCIFTKGTFRLGTSLTRFACHSILLGSLGPLSETPGTE